MKVLLLGFSLIKYMPYASFYINALKNENADLHLLYWNRDDTVKDTALDNVTLHEFNFTLNNQSSKFSKISSFFKYRRFALKLIKEIKPDRIVFLHTFPCFLLFNKLKKKYANKFIFDYRDFTYEKFGFFKNRLNKAIQSSYATFVSSDAYRKVFSPSVLDKVYTSHNIVLDDLDDKRINEKSPSDKIRLSFWGLIRGEELNKKIIEKIANDNRFELHYYGREESVAINLKSFVNTINAENIFFHGEYSPKDRAGFAVDTDIVHNIYLDTNMQMAVTNKYYDGLIYKIPQVCINGSFMGELVKKNGVGISVDIDENFTDKIYEYLNNLDKTEFDANANKALQAVLGEYEKGVQIIKGLIK
ncbi:MAG: hypothetical protein J6V68_05385 [Clostridia bacterium]|nr:hypothetical protein [Clostridia bacterium]